MNRMDTLYFHLHPPFREWMRLLNFYDHMHDSVMSDFEYMIIIVGRSGV